METFSEALLSAKTDKIPEEFDWFSPLIGPEIKEGQDVSALTIVLNGKTYPVYAMSPVDLEKSKIASGRWKVTNKVTYGSKTVKKNVKVKK